MDKENMLYRHNGILFSHNKEWASLVAQLVKNLPAVWEA